MQSTFYHQVLLLNADFTPIRAIKWGRAINMILNGKAESVEDSSIVIRSPSSVSMSAPMVVRLIKYIKVPVKRRFPYRKNHVYKRDDYICQYCGKRVDEHDRTIDHVVPRAQGGQSTFENSVCSCIKCNRKKADRTPQQAGMVLLSIPKKPSKHYLNIPDTYKDVWAKYFKDIS